MNQSCCSPKVVLPALGAEFLKTWSIINRVTAVVVLSACVVTAAAQENSPAFAKFKREMMPKVGQEITVVGTLGVGKDGFWLKFNNWGAYIRAAKESGLARENYLYAHFHSGQTVKVTGTLRHFEPPNQSRTDKYGRVVQTAPEDFYFDAAEVKMSLWPQPGKMNN